jgi:hypothetical protein
VHSGPRTRSPLAPAVFRPPRALGVIIGSAFGAWGLVAGLLAARIAFASAVEFKTFLAWCAAAVLFLAAGGFFYWTISLASLRYVIANGALTIVWGGRRIIIPVNSIQRIVPGRTIEEPRVRGLNWWGCHIGSAEVKRVGFTLFYSTHGTPDELLYLVTTEESYALTVHDQASFAEQVQGRVSVALAAPIIQRSEATGIASLPVWRDRSAITALVISAAMTAALWAYLFSMYPGLPSVLQLSFPDPGAVVRVGSRSALLAPAYLGAAILAVNTVVGIAVHARERAAGLWLLASGGLVQGVLLAAAIIAVRGS